MMKKEVTSIGGRECFFCTDVSPRYLLIQPLDENETDALDREIAAIRDRANSPFAFAAFKINDWNNELSPWEAPAVFGKAGFGSGACQTLEFIHEKLIPSALSHCCIEYSVPFIIGGYSLAALFSLWAVYQTNEFAGVAAASPSVWFPEWNGYVSVRKAQARFVYLSLGDKEEKAKNAVMATVGERIRFQHALLSKQLGEKNCLLEWNAGNHFAEPDIRTGKAFARCIDSLPDNE